MNRRIRRILRAAGEGDVGLGEVQLLGLRRALRDRALEHILTGGARRVARATRILRAAARGHLLLRDGVVWHRAETGPEHVAATTADTEIVTDLITAGALRCAPGGVGDL